MACMELCGSVHTAQREIPTKIPVGFCTHFIGLGVCFCIGHYQCKHIIMCLLVHYFNESEQVVLLSLICILSRILGTRAIRVDWVHPDELNGVLESYVLFASDTFIYEIGNEVYNSTDSFTYYNLNDLAPGTTYFIRLSVSVLNQ